MMARSDFSQSSNQTPTGPTRAVSGPMIPNQRMLGLRLRCVILVVVVAAVSAYTPVAAQTADQADSLRPNIIYFLVDNLGFGELSVYSGGPLRGTWTPQIDSFAMQGVRLTNFSPEAQCTPSRSALMTGRYSIRSGNLKGPSPVPDSASGLVTWEKTIAEVFSENDYKTLIVGKWHIGDADGRWPTDHGFDEWYGILASYGESTWASDPYYRGNVIEDTIRSGERELGVFELQICSEKQSAWEAPDSRDPVSFVTHSVKVDTLKKQSVNYLCQLTLDRRRDIDRKYLDKAMKFIKESKSQEKPFFLYFNHSMMHMPNIPRLRFKDKTGHGDWADALLELDTDFGELMKFLEVEGLKDNTIVVFSGDNGPEDYDLWRGTAGYWDGTYFTGMEGSLRTPAMVRYPGKVKEGWVSNEIVHITDMFTTLIRWAGLEVPQGRVIDGVDQRNFFEGKQNCSDRVGFPYWNGDPKNMYGIKWHNFKVVNVLQRKLSAPALNLPTPNIVNLDRDPKERHPFDLPILHTWVTRHAAKIGSDFAESVKCEALIPPQARLDFVPLQESGCWTAFFPENPSSPKQCDAYDRQKRRSLRSPEGRK